MNCKVPSLFGPNWRTRTLRRENRLKALPLVVTLLWHWGGRVRIWHEQHESLDLSCVVLTDQVGVGGVMLSGRPRVLISTLNIWRWKLVRHLCYHLLITISSRIRYCSSLTMSPLSSGVTAGGFDQPRNLRVVRERMWMWRLQVVSEMLILLFIKQNLLFSGKHD